MRPSLPWNCCSKPVATGWNSPATVRRLTVGGPICWPRSSYVLLPRLLLALWASRHLRQRLVLQPRPATAAAPVAATLAESVCQWPAESHWLDAAWLPEELAGQLPAPLHRPEPWPSPEVLGATPLVVVVRAWEPPLAELADRLRGFHGLILPLDWSENRWREPRATHLQEWRRFAAELPGWKHPERICQLARLVGVRRPGFPELDWERLRPLMGQQRWQQAPPLTVTMPLVGLSSREIRRRCGQGLSIRYQVPRAVEAYIYEHGLYSENGPPEC